MKLTRRSLALASASAPFLLQGSGVAQTASPTIADLESASSRLAGMLGYVPGGILDGVLNITWNDYQKQAA